MCGVMNFFIVELGLETLADLVHFVTVEELYPESFAFSRRRNVSFSENLTEELGGSL